MSKFQQGFDTHSIAFALATGMMILDDQDGEKHARRMRYERRRMLAAHAKMGE